MNEEDIFHEALARNPPDRAAYLDRACAGNPPLRASIDALLRANAGATGFLTPPGQAVAVEPPAAEGPGTAIGPYKLLEQIGEGGFGVVFMAEQTQPVRRKVALKVLKPGMDTQQVVARFEAERQALAIMGHPNIAQVFDGGATTSGRPYFVMELVKGVPITEFCDQNHLTPRQRLELFIPVCHAVQHAHQKGVVHRDLKPSNVLVSMHDTTPVPKVIDFGIAKALGQELTDKTLFTGFAQMIGTPLYMSPEQAGQSGLDIDTRSDIYSLGVLLYELLTGTTPFDKERFRQAAYDEIRRIIREEDPPKPSTRLSDLGRSGGPAGRSSKPAPDAGPASTLASVSASRQTEPAELTKLVNGELDWIVMKALDKDRNRRYDSANGFAADVQRYLDDESVQACPPTAGYRLRKFARRNRRLLAMAGVVFLALLSAVGSLAITAATLSESKDQVVHALGQKTQALDDLREEKKKTDAALAAEQSAAYFRSMAVAHLSFLTGNLIQANEVLDERPPAQRHWEWHYLKRLCQQGTVLHRAYAIRQNQYAVSADGGLFAHYWGDLLSVTDTRAKKRLISVRDEKAGSGRVALSPDGKRLALVAGGSLRVWDTGTAEETHRQNGANSLLAPVFQPGGHLVVWMVKAELRLTDLRTGRDVLTLRPTQTTRLSLFTADGRRLVTVGGPTGGRIEVWDVNSGALLHAHAEPFASLGLALSSDGRFYAACTRTAIRVCELDTGRPVHTLINPTLTAKAGDAVAMSFSPDGKRFVNTGGDKTVRVWDLTTGQQIRTFFSPHDVWYAGFVDDGRGLLTVDSGGGVVVRDIDSAPQGPTLRSPSSANATGIRAATFRPGSRQLAVGFTDGTVRLATTATGAAVFDLPKPAMSAHGGLAFSPDGQWLATAAYVEQAVKVWDARNGQVVASVPCPAGPPDWIAFSPDGRQLAARIVNDGPPATESVQMWETGSWRELFTRKALERKPEGMIRLRAAFSADSQRLAVVTGDDQVSFWDATTGTDVRVVREPGASFRSIGFSPRGRLLAGLGENGAGYFWDAASGERRGVFRATPHQWSVLAFSPDGRRLAYAASSPDWEGEIRLFDVESGRSLLVLPSRGLTYSLQFSADGHRLMAVSTQQGEVTIWDGTPWEPEEHHGSQ